MIVSTVPQKHYLTSWESTKLTAQEEEEKTFHLHKIKNDDNNVCMNYTDMWGQTDEVAFGGMTTISAFGKDAEENNEVE